MNRLPVVTRNILVINVVCLIFWRLMPEFMTSTFALFFPTSDYFHFWQPITYMFMHGGFWHLFMNMFVLYMFGPQLENMWGPKKFLLFYFVCGLGAAACHVGAQWLMLQNDISTITRIAEVGTSTSAVVARITNSLPPTVGASGAIYGILIGFAMLFPDTRLTLIFPPITLKAKWWVIIWALIEVVTGVTGTLDGVAHFAHLGGMLFGYLLILYWKKKGRMYDYES